MANLIIVNIVRFNGVITNQNSAINSSRIVSSEAYGSQTIVRYTSRLDHFIDTIIVNQTFASFKAATEDYETGITIPLSVLKEGEFITYNLGVDNMVFADINPSNVSQSIIQYIEDNLILPLIAAISLADLVKLANVSIEPVKFPARVGTTANINLASAPASIDGITLASGDVVLVKDQITGSQNGLYTFNGAAIAMTRSPGFDTNSEVFSGILVVTTEGTVNADLIFELTTNNPIIVGTTALTFTIVGGVGSISGAGTLNYLSKFTPDGTHIGNSLLFDNGTSMGIGTTTPIALLELKSSTTGTGANIFAVRDNTPSGLFFISDKGEIILGTTIISGSMVSQKNLFNTDPATHKTVTNATNATPIVITTSAAHGKLTGDRARIVDVTGNTAANADWTITRIDGTNFSLDTSVGNGAYISGGTVSFPFVSVMSIRTSLGGASNTLLSLKEKGNIGIGTATPNASSVLDITSTTTGLLIPRMTTAQRDLIASPATSLLVFNADTRLFNYWDGIAALWVEIDSGTGDWNILGNSGTVDGTNFIGTTDDIPFNIRVNNQKAGRIDNTLANTFFGYLAGASTISPGSSNTAFGDNALQANISGTSNVAIGGGALSANTASSNTGIGAGSLNANTIGTTNVAVGDASLSLNVNGNENTAIGSGSMGVNVDGNSNTAVGITSLKTNVDGDFNVAIGGDAMSTNSSGSNNTSVGYASGSVNSTGSNNTYIGYAADASINNLTNATAIGANAVVSANDSLVLGDAAVNVGIGTSSPATKLHVATGELLVGAPSLLLATNVADFYKNQNAGTALMLRNNTSDTDAFSTFFASADEGTGMYAGIYSAGYTSSGIQIASSAGIFTDATAGMNFGTKSNTNSNFWTNNLQRMTILSNGNIGIGNPAPEQLLHLGGDPSGTIGYIRLQEQVNNKFADIYVKADDAHLIIDLIPEANLGIDVDTPTARLHLPAGTVDANTAPLKFTSGDNLTAAVAGAMEYNGTSLFFTPIASRRTVAFLDDGQTFTSAIWNSRIVGKIFTLTDAASIATDAALGNIARVTIAGNRTMSIPTNPLDGQTLIYEITQDGTGSRTITWTTAGAGAFQFTTDVPAPTLTTAVNQTDYIMFRYDVNRANWIVQAVNKGAAA